MDYMSGPNIITKVLKSARSKKKRRVSEKICDNRLRIKELMFEGGHDPKNTASRSWERLGKKIDICLEHLEKHTALPTH